MIAAFSQTRCPGGRSGKIYISKACLLKPRLTPEPLKRAIQAGIPSSPSSFLVKYRRRVQVGFPLHCLQ